MKNVVAILGAKLRLDLGELRQFDGIGSDRSDNQTVNERMRLFLHTRTHTHTRTHAKYNKTVYAGHVHAVAIQCGLPFYLSLCTLYCTI